MAGFQDPAPGLAFDFPQGWLSEDAEACRAADDAAADSLTKDWLQDLEELEGPAEASKQSSPDIQIEGSPLVTSEPEGAPEPGSPASFSSGQLTALPEGVQSLILQHLSCRDLLTASLACRSWHELSHQNSIWGPLHAAAIPVSRGAKLPAEASNAATTSDQAATVLRQPSAQANSTPPQDSAVMQLLFKEQKPQGTCSALAPVGLQRNGITVLKKKPLEQHGHHRAMQRHFTAATEPAGEEGVQDRLPGLLYHLTKSTTLAVQSGKSLGSLWQVHDVMRMALCDLWTDNHACCAANLQCALRKLSRFSWSIAYEALNVGFHHRADVCALLIPSQRIPDGGCMQAVVAAWHRYNTWLGRVAGACGLLAECVSAERAAEAQARGRFQTPSISDAAQLAFRSQVVLSYRLRGRLQDEILAGLSPELAGEAGRMLEVLDVVDDTTRGASYQTQDKFNRMFGSESACCGVRPGRKRLPSSFHRPQKMRKRH